MLQKLPKFLEVAQKTASCPKVAEQLVDRATINSYTRKHILDLERFVSKSFEKHTELFPLLHSVFLGGFLVPLHTLSYKKSLTRSDTRMFCKRNR